MATTLREVLARGVAAGTPTFSFEFFAPKTESGTRNLWDAVRRIEPLSPTFCLSPTEWAAPRRTGSSR
jgi:methylenetetrahydrofolate reductase (NADPH)